MWSQLPALLVGLIVAAYWARVLRMARKIRRLAGHSANVIPPEPIGQFIRIIWFPITFLWIAIPLTVPFMQSRLWILRPLYDLPVLQWAGFCVAGIAFALTWICWKKMGKSWRMGIDPNETTSLIVTGPYAYIRHPIYALSSVLMLATVAAEPVPILIAVAVVHLIFLQLEARREERHQARVHGQMYLDYCAKTGGFIPRF
jgi:protein-S-isoprenylcysteine O-methyltransferase Ste14